MSEYERYKDIIRLQWICILVLFIVVAGLIYAVYNLYDKLKYILEAIP